jgi:hypothetical protein
VLAGLLGRSVEWLAQFERGARELDRLFTIVAIADALGIDPVKLLPAAFTARRWELRDAVVGTAPDCVAAIKAAMFRYNGSARVCGVLTGHLSSLWSWRCGSMRRLRARRPSVGHGSVRCSLI